MNNKIKCKWQKDRARYPLKPWLKEPSIIAIRWYRYGQSVDLMNDGWIKKLNLKVYWLIFHILEVILGISIPKSVKAGGGLRIYHFGNIFIHRNAKLGDNCTLRQGVTIGNRYNDSLAPNLSNNVELGAYAQILGDIKIGENVKIGAMSVVLKDIEANMTAYGVPAKMLPSREVN
ncbi:serine acetyltransferase [Pseudoalteromonas sp. NBT06-2]|uniref:serine acetyltransferase n=1 Tax=Pseudoalteromonas sp. NBT06-2 TaxID=2025950 RepID=UPI001BAEDA62|nr:serine acetyltransferase [Pseudoalteromonas sp. NBT06-2]